MRLFDLTVIQNNLPLLLHGAWYTALLSVNTLALGCIGGAILCVGRMQSNRILRWLAAGFIDFFRTIPEPIPIIWLYACAPFLFDIRLPAEVIGMAALSTIAAAYFSEIFRAGVISIPSGQFDAGNALGLSRMKIYGLIVFPQAFRTVLPPAVNVLTDIVKSTSLLSLIAITELAYEAATISARTFRYLEIYTVAGLLYFVMIFSISMIARRLELRPGESRQPRRTAKVGVRNE